MTTTPHVEDRMTALLRAWQDGDAAAKSELFDALYDRLRAIARQRMARERGDTWAPTVLVHEVFLRLDEAAIQGADRAAFLRLAATVMRRILIDGARRRAARRRATAAVARAANAPPTPDSCLVRLDAALDRLAERDPQLLRVVELRFLIGMDVAGCAAALGRSTASVKRDWRTARAFLQREIERDER